MFDVLTMQNYMGKIPFLLEPPVSCKKQAKSTQRTQATKIKG
jgi:hypothetical protein